MTICDICPHSCHVPESSFGRCKVIRNDSGIFVNPYSGYCTVLTVDPIEKKPFYYFCPGTKFLSVGFSSCNFTCTFCQNYLVSQTIPEKSKYLTAKDLTSLALSKGVSGIAFTYNEPILYYEYIIEVSKLIRTYDLPLKVAVKTNGFAMPRIAEMLGEWVDAFNVDLKGNEEDYVGVCGGHVEPVWKFIEAIVDKKVHLEISYLVLSSRINDADFHNSVAQRIRQVGDIPVHILYLYPFYLMHDRYEQSKLSSVQEIMQKYLSNVHLSNIYSRGKKESHMYNET